MKLFLVCLQIVFFLDGGWYAGDGGTNYGIRASTLLEANRRGIVRQTDIREITQFDAARIYYRMYWIPSGAGKLNYPLCLVVFDAAVHAGVGKSRQLLREAIKAQIQMARIAHEKQERQETKEKCYTQVKQDKQQSQQIHISQRRVALQMVVGRWQHLRSLNKFPKRPGWRKRMQVILSNVLKNQTKQTREEK